MAPNSIHIDSQNLGIYYFVQQRNFADETKLRKSWIEGIILAYPGGLYVNTSILTREGRRQECQSREDVVMEAEVRGQRSEWGRAMSQGTQMVLRTRKARKQILP